MNAGPSPRGVTWTAEDRSLLAARGIAVAEAERQVELLGRPIRHVELDRPCTVGDGIERVAPDEAGLLSRLHAESAAAGELAAFVPASGAATRMFQDLLACLADGRALTRDEIEHDLAGARATSGPLRALLAGLPRLAFGAELLAALERRGFSPVSLLARGPYRPLLETLLAEPGLGLAALPKGLIPFHLGPEGPRTAFEEHLADAATLFRARDGLCRLHFTVPAEQRGRFEALLARVREGLERRYRVRFEVSFSAQDPASDTLALDEAGEPARDADGSLLLRPAGHGALLANLARLEAPIAVIRNVDNVTAEPFKGPTLEGTRTIVGRLCRLRASRDELLRRLDDPRDAAAPGDALGFARAALGREAAEAGDEPEAARRARAVALLERPLRVCGVVPNTGEPGGGPFWVRGPDGSVSRQIVESAEVDSASPRQLACVRAATHFNPVLMACALHDAAGRPYALERFADPAAAIVTRKSQGARDVVALERPGLWNGAMAHWGTVFVELPLAVFNPVKTVLDLLRPEHQPASS